MTSKENAKEKILAAGAQIIHRKGYNHTGIQEILKAAGVPKGSFYFYFKNKEDFGLQVVDYFRESLAEMVREKLRDQSLSPLKRLEGVFDRFIEFFESMNFTGGCPIGNLAQEMGDLSPEFSDKLRFSVDSMAKAVMGLLEEAVLAGEISKELDIEDTARFIVSSWHGALVHMKIAKSSGPLLNHKNFTFRHILSGP